MLRQLRLSPTASQFAIWLVMLGTFSCIALLVLGACVIYTRAWLAERYAPLQGYRMALMPMPGVRLRRFGVVVAGPVCALHRPPADGSDLFSGPLLLCLLLQAMERATGSPSHQKAACTGGVQCRDSPILPWIEAARAPMTARRKGTFEPPWGIARPLRAGMYLG